MADIYQAIWDADQAHNGVKAVKAGTPITEELRRSGYVEVDEKKTAGTDHRVIANVVIPNGKTNTYRLADALFDNFTLEQTKREEDYPDEVEEVQAFINAIYKTHPMDVARAYVAERSGEDINDEKWWSIIERVWFERFDQGLNRDLSGFEHVVVGEQKQGKVQGYHFWYKYHMDEHITLVSDRGNAREDLIDFIKGLQREEDVSPEVVTLSFKWNAFDYQRRQFRPLTKPVGGFWVGPSVEGLMAMGTVRCLPEAMAPKRATINGVVYNLPMYRSPNDRNLRTFYPEFVRMAQDGE